MGRSQRRAGILDPLSRVTLLEADVDGIEMEVDGFRDALATQTKLLTGILVAVTTASILMAINLLVAGR